MLDQIGLWAVIDENCNTFFNAGGGGPSVVFSLPQVSHLILIEVRGTKHDASNTVLAEKS